jgi:hypothetical protein
MPSIKKTETERLIRVMRAPTKVAYVHHDIAGKKVAYKHLYGQENTTGEFVRP